MKDGLLHRLSKRPSGEEVAQFVLPKEFHEAVLKSLHDDLGHLGFERTTDLLRSRLFWPKMSKDAEHHVKNCGERPASHLVKEWLHYIRSRTLDQWIEYV